MSRCGLHQRTALSQLATAQGLQWQVLPAGRSQISYKQAVTFFAVFFFFLSLYRLKGRSNYSKTLVNPSETRSPEKKSQSECRSADHDGLAITSSYPEMMLPHCTKPWPALARVPIRSRQGHSLAARATLARDPLAFSLTGTSGSDWIPPPRIIYIAFLDNQQRLV